MLRTLLAAAVAAVPALAQTLTVDYPDSTLGAAAGQYPIYTGTGTNVIRGQLFCPSTFAGLPTSTMVCTRVGVQLAEVTGPILYTQFVVRVGATTIPALTNTWDLNLPDQRVQVDLSNQVIAGGVGGNQWFEWQLAAPFVLQPGEGVVLDITSQTSVGGQYLRTAIGTGVPRLISTNYTGSPQGGTPQASGGIKFRLVFEPGGFVVAGAGCPGTGNFVPAIDCIGQPTIGNQAFTLTLQNALGSSLCALLLGFPANLDIGGGCRVQCDGLGFNLLGTAGAGPGQGTAAFGFPIPNQPWLAGIVLDAQWGVLDPGSGSPLGITMSSGGKMILQ